jgi:hypothetical protein
MESHEGAVAADDLLLFVNAAITSTGQREFHSSAGEQRMSLAFLHEYMLVNYRPLYAAALALDINDHNAVTIVRQLLANGRDTGGDRLPQEGLLIGRRLRLLPPQRVYALFATLRRERVNNRRTRAVIRDWMAARPDPHFDAVKYRGGVRSALRHTHLRPPVAEVGPFLFAPRSVPRFDAPLLDAWRRAHYDRRAVYELPFTVAEGFAARHGIPRSTFLERIAPNMTRLERLRAQRSAEAAGAGAVAADLSRMPLTRLAGHVLGLALDERVARRAELTSAFRTAARRAAGNGAGTWGRVAAVLDDSHSTSGSGEKRRRPLAVTLACHWLLEALAGHYTPVWTSGRHDALLVHPYGATPLGHRVLDALETRPERLVIVSDGWDNAPPGLAGEVLRVWRTRLDPGARTTVTHLNPVYDAAEFEVRKLAPGVPTAGIRDAEDLPALVELARFTEGRTDPAALRAYLDMRVKRFLTVGEGAS